MTRRPASALAALPPHLSHAAATYAATFEAVAAGGASTGDGGGGELVSGGSPAKEGRQFQAVKLVEFLRRMEAAVGPSAVLVAPRTGRTVAALDLWRATTVGGLSMARYMEARGLSRDADRQRILRATLIAAAERVADAIGGARSPWAD